MKEHRGGRVVERIAHAFDPAGWSGPCLAAGVVLFGFVLAVTVIQRALLADTITEWAITCVHGVVVIVVVPLLSIRTVREWRRNRTPPQQHRTPPQQHRAPSQQQ